MYSYGLLEPGCYYLVQEKAEDGISLIKVTNETEQCMYVFYYGDQLATAWKRKTDSILDIIECLTDEAVQEWEKHYNDNQDAYHEEDED
jgi:tRNA U34 5-methylaminomethyl-2-thiouridine-forming methyltransferase MnmC